MADSAKPVAFSPELAEKMFKLRFQNEHLFKRNKLPWQEFHKVLLANGFPKELTVSRVRKKWGNAYESYKLARKMQNKDWKYYKLFHRHYGHQINIDKFENWNDEWQIKLVNVITNAKTMKLNQIQFWRTVEITLREQKLPLDCCIQDLKPLWQYLKKKFEKKHRPIMYDGDVEIDWPPFTAMLRYYRKFEKDYFKNGGIRPKVKTECSETKVKLEKIDKNAPEFQWSKDITESFIQIRLQNECLFWERVWAWNDFKNILVNEHNFPKSMTSQDLCKKWSTIMREYQKAQATKNTTWIYHELFQSYYNDGNLHLNPFHKWEEKWIKAFIDQRTDLDYLFTEKYDREPWKNFREVEKGLRSAGIPLECSLMDLHILWDFLMKTFTWKQKFTQKGILSVPWPFYNAMLRHVMVRERRKKGATVKNHAVKNNSDGSDDGHVWTDDDDDVKLFDLKQRMNVDTKIEVAEVNSCRACTREGGCVNIFNNRDSNGLDLAQKMHLLCGVEIKKTDDLPKQLCFTCVGDLQTAYKFRERCRAADEHHRVTINKLNTEIDIKQELNQDDDQSSSSDTKLIIDTVSNEDLGNDVEFYIDGAIESPSEVKPKDIKPQVKTESKIKVSKINQMKRKRYLYYKVCEVCGLNTPNLKNHMDAHSNKKKYSCDVCDKKFKFKSSLQLHRANHEPQPRKTCEVCGKSFHILSQYRRHFVYHSNKREFECETCGKRFNTIEILKVHVRIHTNERPYSCSDCGKSFRTAGCVGRHRRIVHKFKKKLIPSCPPPQ